MRKLFNNNIFCRAVLLASLAIGVCGILSGVWLASRADSSALAGLVGGAVMLAIAYVGLRPGSERSKPIF